MEDQILALTAELAAVKSAAQVTNTMFAEMYYYVTIPLMVLIHAGFLLYEMGATRVKNVLSSGMKNLLAFAFTIITFYLFGWCSIGPYQRSRMTSPLAQDIWRFQVSHMQVL